MPGPVATATYDSAMVRAYELDQLGHDRAGAVAAIREAFSEPESKLNAKAELARLAGVVAARSRGAECGCHVSKVQRDLLALALEDNS